MEDYPKGGLLWGLTSNIKLLLASIIQKGELVRLSFKMFVIGLLRLIL